MLRDEMINGGSMSVDGARPCVMVAVLGAGQRGRVRFHAVLMRGMADLQVYAEYALSNPDKMKVVAVADPRPHRLGVMGREHQYVSIMNSAFRRI
jgi:predicted dehydrogenase